MPPRNDDNTCCTSDDDTMCCMVFMKFCAYIGFAGLTMISYNHLVAVAALVDADFNAHHGIYGEIPDTNIVVTRLMIIQLTIMTLGIGLVRSRVITMKAFVGVLGAHVFWCTLITIAFINHLKQHDGRYFRCTGKTLPKHYDDPTDNLVYDPVTLDNCMSHLDDTVLTMIGSYLSYGCLGSLVIITLAGMYTWRHHPRSIDMCEAGTRVLFVLGEVCWYLAFPIAATTFIMITGSDTVMHKPPPAISTSTTHTDTKHLRQANVVDSSTPL